MRISIKTVFLGMIVLVFILTAQTIRDGAPRTLAPVPFSSLTSMPDGTILYCPDCTQTNPVGSGGSGSFAIRRGGAWYSTAGPAGTPGTPGAAGGPGPPGAPGTNGAISNIGVNSVTQPVQPRLNLIQGTNVTISAVNNTGSTDVTISASGGGGGPCPTCVTSAASLAANQLLIGGGSQLAQTIGSLGTSITVLHGNAGGAPTFGAVSLSSDVSGLLGYANGGTNASTSWTQGSIIFAGPASFSQDNANLSWDGTNHCLNVGNAVSGCNANSVAVMITGNILFSGSLRSTGFLVDSSGNVTLHNLTCTGTGCGGAGITPYTLCASGCNTTVPASGTTISSATHGQGAMAEYKCYDSASPHNLTAIGSATSAASPLVAGNLTITYSVAPAYCEIYTPGSAAGGGGGGGGSVFTGSTATTPAFSATPTFSLADISVKSPLRVEPGAMTANVTAVTFTNTSAGAKFSIVWLQDGTGGRTVTYGGSTVSTCPIITTPSTATTQEFEVAADGTTVKGTGCFSNVGTTPGMQSCGLTSTCATTVVTNPQLVIGSVPLVSGSPSTATMNGINPAFTSTSTYWCLLTPEGASIGVFLTKINGSSFIITGPASVTTTVDFACFGN